MRLVCQRLAELEAERKEERAGVEAERLEERMVAEAFLAETRRGMEERADQVERGLRARLSARSDELALLLAELHTMRAMQVHVPSRPPLLLHRFTSLTLRLHQPHPTPPSNLLHSACASLPSGSALMIIDDAEVVVCDMGWVVRAQATTMQSSDPPSAIPSPSGRDEFARVGDDEAVWVESTSNAPVPTAPAPLPSTSACATGPLNSQSVKSTTVGDTCERASRRATADESRSRPIPPPPPVPAGGAAKVCSRCGLNDQISPGRCAFHPFLARCALPSLRLVQLLLPLWCWSAHLLRPQRF